MEEILCRKCVQTVAMTTEAFKWLRWLFWHCCCDYLKTMSNWNSEKGWQKVCRQHDDDKDVQVESRRHRPQRRFDIRRCLPGDVVYGSEIFPCSQNRSGNDNSNKQSRLMWSMLLLSAAYCNFDWEILNYLINRYCFQMTSVIIKKFHSDHVIWFPPLWD